MPNMSLEKVKMPEQEVTLRARNFGEVNLGYTVQMAQEESGRCLNCKNSPCVAGYPVNVMIPEFISFVSAGEFEKAFRTIKQTNAFPAVCGRVCPQENQCEKLCVRGIKGEPVAIGRLERFVADFHMENSGQTPEAAKKNGHKAAVIGAGPAGLSCAGDLALRGYDVTIFEAFHTPGSVLVICIPEFRLPKGIVEKEIESLKALGVKIETNTVVGKTISANELFEDGFEAVFIGSGAGLPSFMNIEGEALLGVCSANEYLTRVTLIHAYDEAYDTPIKLHKKVAVVGGGNVAMDAARCAMRLGAQEVIIVYRRSMEELPARAEEVHHAKEEGISFNLLVNPVRILGDEKGQVRAIECVRMELGEPDSSGRRRPIVIEGSNFEIEADCVIMSIGTSPNPLISRTTDGLDVNKWGCIIVDKSTMATSRKGVYAGGDAVTGAATVIFAMGAGKTAAKAINEYIQSQ